ncbi:hypothetical protein [Streptomyces sp. NPDC005349]|uniref:hypothetical protein n=1 Tax=unclassified Streptomyces TaxID=2593676 RepID=UPI0033B6B565
MTIDLEESSLEHRGTRQSALSEAKLTGSSLTSRSCVHSLMRTGQPHRGYCRLPLVGRGCIAVQQRSTAAAATDHVHVWPTEAAR